MSDYVRNVSSAGKNEEASTGVKSFKQGWECLTTDREGLPDRIQR